MRFDAADGVLLAGWFLLDRDCLNVGVVGEVAVEGERYLAEFSEPQSCPTTNVFEYETGLAVGKTAVLFRHLPVEGADGVAVIFATEASTEIKELAIYLHLRCLSICNTVYIIDIFDVNRARSTVHNWVQKVDFEPRGGRDSETIALDVTIIDITKAGFGSSRQLSRTLRNYVYTALSFQKYGSYEDVFTRVPGQTCHRPHRIPR